MASREEKRKMKLTREVTPTGSSIERPVFSCHPYSECRRRPSFDPHPAWVGPRPVAASHHRLSIDRHRRRRPPTRQRRPTAPPHARPHSQRHLRECRQSAQWPRSTVEPERKVIGVYWPDRGFFVRFQELTIVELHVAAAHRPTPADSCRRHRADRRCWISAVVFFQLSIWLSFTPLNARSLVAHGPLK